MLMLLTFLIIAANLKISSARTEDNGVDETDAQMRIARVNTALYGKFVYQLALSNPNKTVLTSVYPLLCALAQLAMFSEGSTHRQLMELIDQRSQAEIRTVFPLITTEYNSTGDGISKLALKVYADEKDPFCSVFIKRYGEICKGITGNVNFGKPKSAAKEINRWVQYQSPRPGATENLVRSSIITKRNGLIFVSSQYFVIDWDDRYIPKGLKDLDFYPGGDKKIVLPAMYGKAYLKYVNLKSIDAQLLEIPLKGGKYSLLLMLPNKVGGVPELLNKFRDPTLLEIVLSKMKQRCLYIHVPLVEAYAQVDLAKSLKQVNNKTEIFDPELANLSGISEGCEDDYVASVLHEIRFIADDGVTKDKYTIEDTDAEMAVKVCREGKVHTLKTDRPVAYYILNPIRNKIRTPIIAGTFFGKTYAN